MQELSSLESLQQSYDTLKRHVEALEQEWQDAKPLQDLNEFETEFFEEHTAKEVVAFFICVYTETVLPFIAS